MKTEDSTRRWHQILFIQEQKAQKSTQDSKVNESSFWSESIAEFSKQECEKHIYNHLRNVQCLCKKTNKKQP